MFLCLSDFCIAQQEKKHSFSRVRPIFFCFFASVIPKILYVVGLRLLFKQSKLLEKRFGQPPIAISSRMRDLRTRLRVLGELDAMKGYCKNESCSSDIKLESKPSGRH